MLGHDEERRGTVLFEARCYQVGNGWVHAHVSDGGGPVVVLVPGPLAMPGSWLPFAMRAARDFRVVVPALSSDGDAGGADPESIPRLARMLPAALAAAGVERSVVVGTGFGCHTAVALAATHPERLRGLVLQGPLADPALRRLSGLVVRALRAARHEPLVHHLLDLLALRRHELRRALGLVSRLGARRLEDAAGGCAYDLAGRLPLAWLQEVPGAPHDMSHAAPDALAAVVGGFVELVRTRRADGSGAPHRAGPTRAPPKPRRPEATVW